MKNIRRRESHNVAMKRIFWGFTKYKNNEYIKKIGREEGEWGTQHIK